MFSKLQSADPEQTADELDETPEDDGCPARTSKTVQMTTPVTTTTTTTKKPASGLKGKVAGVCHKIPFHEKFQNIFVFSVCSDKSTKLIKYKSELSFSLQSQPLL